MTLTLTGGKLQMAMWLTFFNHLGFVRVSPAPDAPGQETLELHRDFPKAKE